MVKTLLRRTLLFSLSLSLVVWLASVSGVTGSRDEFPDPPTGPFVDVSAAPVIVVGTVGESSSYWSDEDQLIYTVAEFEVSDTQRGEASKSIKITNVGGVVGDLTIRVTHQPTFDRGTKSRLFLTPLGDGTYQIVGGEDGKQDSAERGVAEALSTCGEGVFAGDGYCLANERFPNTAFPIAFRVNPNTPDVAGEENAVIAAFDTWENDGPSRVDFTYTGTTAIACHAHDGTNVIYWGTVSCGVQCNATACSMIAAQNGIDTLGYDTWMNDNNSQVVWSIGAAAGKVDVQTVAVHEAGHWLGLTHTIGDCSQVMGVISDGPSPPAVPCPIVGTTKRNLNSGDQRGVRALYPGDNTLLQAPPAPQVYASRINLGPPSDDDATGRRLIPDLVSLEGHGFSWGNVLTTRSNFLNAFPTGDNLIGLTSPGILLKGSGVNYYVMQVVGGSLVKRWITHPDVMAACGYTASQVYTISDTQLASITTGSPLTGTPCPPKFIPPHRYLIKGSAPEVYVISGSKRRHVTSPAVMAMCGYKWGNLNVMATTYVFQIPEDPPLTGAPCP